MTTKVDNWKIDLDAAKVELRELEKMHAELKATDFPDYTAYWSARAELNRECKKTRSRITRLEGNIVKATDGFQHFDHFDQPIKVGCNVVHCDSSGYARVHVRNVTSLSHKRVQLDGYANIDPASLIVVDMLLDWQAAKKQEEAEDG